MFHNYTFNVMIIMANEQVDYKDLRTSRGGRYLCVRHYMYRIGRRGANEVDYWKCTTIVQASLPHDKIFHWEAMRHTIDQSQLTSWYVSNTIEFNN